MNEKIAKQANEVVNNFVKKELNLFVDKMYPKLVKMVGGKEKLLFLLNNQMNAMKDKFGFILNIDSAVVSEINPIIESENELQTSFVESIYMSTKKSKIKAVSTFIAISEDKGNTWYFIDTPTDNLQDLIKIFPNLSDKLIIKKKEMNIIY